MYLDYIRLRDQMGMTDADVARATGIGKSTFSDWKSGRSSPKVEKLSKIADLFGVKLAEFTKTKDPERKGERKRMELPAYVYFIKCSVNGRIYVGRTKNPEKRWASHLQALRKRQHDIYLLQTDFDKYGEKSFQFMTVAKINEYEERVLEKDLMLFMETYDPNKGYNYADKYFEPKQKREERMESIQRKYGIDKKMLFRDAS